MPDKNLTAGTKVLLLGNVYDDPKVDVEMQKPLEECVGEVVGPSAYDEQWGERWIVRVPSGELDMSEQDLSPIPSLYWKPRVSLEPTERGFMCADFTDLYGSQCSIQQSSLATEGALWLGINDNGHFNARVPVEKWNEKVYGTRSTGGRMHLSQGQGQVIALLPLLLEFAETGQLPSPRCPECAVRVQEPHKSGCDVERCSVCKGQKIACHCEGHDPQFALWTGEWPGVIECRERSWYSVLIQGRWRPCSKDFPGATEDLNRWVRFQMTGRDSLEGEPLLDDL